MRRIREVIRKKVSPLAHRCRTRVKLDRNTQNFTSRIEQQELAPLCCRATRTRNHSGAKHHHAETQLLPNLTLAIGLHTPDINSVARSLAVETQSSTAHCDGYTGANDAGAAHSLSVEERLGVHRADRIECNEAAHDCVVGAVTGDLRDRSVGGNGNA